MPVPNLIEKFTVFIQVISLTMGRIVPGLAKAMERTTNFNIMEPFHDNCGRAFIRDICEW